LFSLMFFCARIVALPSVTISVTVRRALSS
jgi:hypothetical protein